MTGVLVSGVAMAIWPQPEFTTAVPAPATTSTPTSTPVASSGSPRMSGDVPSGSAPARSAAAKGFTKAPVVKQGQPTLQPSTTATTAPVIGHRYTTTGLNVRTAASADSKVITVLASGAKVSLTNGSVSGWTAILHNGDRRWVRSQYLSTTKPSVAATSSSSSPSLIPGRVVNAKTYGALCDGSHDDRPAIVRALGYLSSKGGGTLTIPAGNCRFLQTGTSGVTGVGANISIRGTGASTSRLMLACDSRDSYREMFRISGGNVSIENVSLVRSTACAGVMIALRPYTGFTLRNVIMDGQYQLGGGGMHALIQPHLSSGTYKNISLIGTTIKNFPGYGLLQPNSATTATDGIFVDGCTFSGNGSDDLEFNAPNGSMINVTVKNSKFLNNRHVGSGAGFAIGMANVENVMLSNNLFDGYNIEPIHIENHSSNVTVQDSSFKRSFLESRSWASHVNAMSGVQNVTIRRNTFDTSANTHSINVIFVGAGGAGAPEPHNVKILSNKFLLRPLSKMAYYSGISGVTITGNTVTNIP
jgi:hypothetical protein